MAQTYEDEIRILCKKKSTKKELKQYELDNDYDNHEQALRKLLGIQKEEIEFVGE